MAFAQNFLKAIAIESNENLIPILEWNTFQLNIQNLKFIHNSAENFLLTDNQYYDLIYIDPSRKNQNQKVYHPKDCSPNIFELIPILFSKSNQILIKLSPMIEVNELQKWFQHIEWIWIISKENECKEILILLNPTYNQPPKFRISIIQKSEIFVYQSFNEVDKIKKLENIHNQELQNYNYVLIPDVAFVKAHLLEYLSKQIQGFLTSNHDGILFLNKNPNTYYGRIKKNIQVMNLNEFTDYQKKHSLWKGQVIKKHFPLKIEEIKKKWKLIDGNQDTFIFFKIGKQSKVVHCKEI